MRCIDISDKMTCLTESLASKRWFPFLLSLQPKDVLPAWSHTLWVQFLSQVLLCDFGHLRNCSVPQFFRLENEETVLSLLEAGMQIR